MTKPRSSYYQVTDGEWIRPPKRGFREQCCGCGLVHVVDYRIVDGKHVEFRCRVDHRATNGARTGRKKR